jgi:hypothetical protein
MSLELQYDSCDDLLPDHYYDKCPDTEFGRVRGSGFIEQDYLATLLAAPITPATWQTGITNGKIISIPQTSGNYDPGEPKELKGYGDQKGKNGPRGHKLVFNDPNYVQNYQFYNEISKSSSLVPFFRTSSLIHIADKPAKIFAKDVVDDDLEAEVNWQVTCDWESENLTRKFAAAAVRTTIGLEV